MTAIPSHDPRPIERRRDADPARADDPVVLLVFSALALLSDLVALLMQGTAGAVPLRFALIAGAAPVAAMFALRLAGPVDDGGSSSWE